MFIFNTFDENFEEKIDIFFLKNVLNKGGVKNSNSQDFRPDLPNNEKLKS